MKAPNMSACVCACNNVLQVSPPTNHVLVSDSIAHAISQMISYLAEIIQDHLGFTFRVDENETNPMQTPLMSVCM